MVDIVIVIVLIILFSLVSAGAAGYFALKPRTSQLGSNKNKSSRKRLRSKCGRAGEAYSCRSRNEKQAA